MSPLPYHDHRHQRAAQWLVEEAHLLDEGRYEAWLDLLHPDIVYRMPVRVTAVKAIDETSVQTMDHFDEDHYSLTKRVERFATDHAWTEDPPSRTRHHVSNVRTFADGADPPTLRVESSVLLYRSRGDRTEPSLLSAGRCDELIEAGDDGRLLLRRRTIEIDDSVLRTQNLAIFL